MRFRGLFVLLWAAALVPVLAAPTRAGNVRITLTGTITSASAGMGYSVGQPVSFFWDVNDYAPRTPKGNASGGIYNWEQGVAGTEPQLWADAGGTGISGTYQEGPGIVPWDRLQVKQTGFTDNFHLAMRTDAFNTTTNNRGIFLTANPSFLISKLTFIGSIDSLFPASAFSGPLPNPTAFLSNYFGTYDMLSESSGEVEARNGFSDELTATFNASSVNIAPVAPVPEPSTWAMAAAGIACAGWGAWRRRRAR